MDIICFNDELLTLIKKISINIDILEFMDYFPLLKQGKACIETIQHIIKSYVLFGNETNLSYDVMDDNMVYNRYIKLCLGQTNEWRKEYDKEQRLAHQLFDIISLYKSKDHIINAFSFRRRIELLSQLAREKCTDLSLYILYMFLSLKRQCIGKILNNNYVELASYIYSNYSNRKNNKYYVGVFEYKTLKEIISIDLGNLDPRYGNNTLYRFAKLLDETETCQMIEKATIKRNWIEKQVLINNFEDLIGPSDIPNNIFNYIINLKNKNDNYIIK